MTIIVNGQRCVLDNEALSYSEVVRLADPPAPVRRLLSVTYRFKDGRGGILVPGESLNIQDGTIFKAYDTSNA